MPLNSPNTLTDAAAVPRFRFGLFLWVIGLLGVVVITVTALPEFLGQVTLPAPLWLISLAGSAQSALFLGFAVWVGVALAPAVGLRAPVLQAVVTGRPVARALKSQLLPALIAGVLAGMLLLAFNRNAPIALREVLQRFSLPIAARVLYGGITEELLLRWGLMTALVWLPWRFLQHRSGAVRARFVWLGIVASAFLFGVGHLPAALYWVGAADANVMAYVVGGNMLIGVLFGYLFWKYGLESAMIAHALTHVVSYSLSRS